jgi:hypothetical protein
VLTIPQNLSDVVAATPQVSTLAATISGQLPDLIGNLTQTRGVTLFLPTNDGVTAAADALSSANVTTLTNVLLNHIIK